MSLLTNVHAENKSERKLSVFIFNLIIFVMSFFILVTYATQPFFKATAKAELTKETLVELVDFGNKDINVADLLGDEGVELALEIVIPAELMFDTAAKVLNRIIFYFNTDVDLSDVATELLDENIDLLVDQFLPTLESLALNAAKQLAVTKGKDALLDTLTGGDAEKTAEFEEKLEDAGITDEYLENKMDTITNALQADNATKESVADAVVNVMDEIIADMQTKADTDLHIDSIDDATLKQNVIDALETFAQEDGSIDFDAAIADLFNKMLSDETASNSEVALLSATVNEEQTDSVSELKTNLRNKILESLGEDIYTSVANGLKIASLLLIFSMFTWVYLMIKIIVKLFMKDNTVKFKLPILFGGIPGLLWLVPSIFMHFLKTNSTLTANPYNLALTFASSGWLAILGALVLIIITAPYSALRKSIRGKKLRNFR